MEKIKITLSIFFFILGLSSAIFTVSLLDKNSLGFVTAEEVRGFNKVSVGIDSSNDGVATGLGIISGFSFLSSVLLLNTAQIKNEE
ncbi:MAG: hypothetical protein A2068_05315 [Ignavibacteria bacterium GWB2_35_6b]|nr:MAG: hypothetical protein A2068_05315 [Ignavibacteria bacterium GWB2_35_6b]